MANFQGFPSGHAISGKTLPCSEVLNQYRTLGNAEAAKAINDAFTQNSGVRVNRMFQDGPDHMHLEVIQVPKMGVETRP